MTERFDLTPAALYARVSSDRQDVDLSIAAQLRALRDYAEKHDYLVAREYVDEAESGRIADRPEFQKMLNEANKPGGPLQGDSRLEILPIHPQARARRRLQVHAETQRSPRRSPSPSRPTTPPRASSWRPSSRAWTNFTAENLAQEVVRGMREAALRGFWMTTYAPYGYRRVYVQDGAAKRPKLELDPARRRRGPAASSTWCYRARASST